MGAKGLNQYARNGVAKAKKVNHNGILRSTSMVSFVIHTLIKALWLGRNPIRKEGKGINKIVQSSVPDVTQREHAGPRPRGPENHILFGFNQPVGRREEGVKEKGPGQKVIVSTCM